MKRTHWIAAGAVAAMLAAVPAVRAQDAATTPAVPSAAPVDIPTIAPAAPIDYSVLRHQNFTYTDLTQARAAGLSDDQVAAIAMVADQTGQRFDTVREDLLRGATYPQLAVKYNLPLDSFYSLDDEKAKITAYKQAYETTGWYAIRAMQNGGMMSSDMSSGSMSTNTGMSTGNTSSSSTSATNTSSTATASPGTSMTTGTGDVVDMAMATPQLSTLAQLIQAAGLVDTLKGAGPFTIFAPNNAAFRRIPRAQLAALQADPTALKNLLTYHVIAGQKIDAAAAMTMTSPTSPPTVQGGTLQVITRNGQVMINNATVVRPDIQASNGIIHIINRVLTPPAATAGTTGSATTGQ